jgi:hypothetical protein
VRHHTRRARLGGWAAAGCLLLGLLAVPAAGEEVAGAEPAPLNLWPVYQDRVDAVDRAKVQEGLGPFVASQRALDGSSEDFALRPFFHRQDERRPLDRTEWELLYPLMTYSRTGQDWEFQFLQLINFRHEGLPHEREQRADFFPFYLSGTTETGQRYQGVLPVYGRVYDRLGQDEADWVMFPLYAHFVKQGVETQYFPWPLLSRTRGEKRSGFRVIPFYGEDRQEGVSEMRFVLWPLFIQQRTGLNSDNPEETLSVLPFYIRQHSQTRDSTTVLWPFFNYTRDRERQYEQWDAPWPLVQIARGEGRTTNRFLPFFSVERRVLRHEFLLKEMVSTNLIVLFPLYSQSVDEVATGRTVRDRVLWWLYSDTRETGQDGVTRRIDSWPLFHYERDREGAVSFWTLALLEPFMPGNEKVEQSYSPLWSIYTYRRNAAGDSAWSFLWNLLRQEDTRQGVTVEILGPILTYREAGENAHLSLLGGLFQYEVRHGVRFVRLFRDLALSWTPVPQRVATLDSTGGSR